MRLCVCVYRCILFMVCACESYQFVEAEGMAAADVESMRGNKIQINVYVHR